MDIKDVSEKHLITRQKLNEVLKWLPDDRIILIIGSRQVGKTSMIFLIMQHLLNYQRDNIFYFDLEDFDILNLLDSGVENFIKYLKSRGADLNRKIYVFLDEIQYLKNPSKILKLLSDHYKNIKIIASGSSTLDIKRKFQDSLVGRKVVFEINTLRFDEYLLFKNRKDLCDILKDFELRNFLDLKISELGQILNIYRKEFKAEFDEYVIFGGYPAVVLENNIEKKKVLLNEIHSSYVRKDIGQLFSIENVSRFNDLVKFLSLQAGSLLNYNSLCSNLRTTYVTLERYLFILQSTFIIKLVSPWYTNKNKELIKMPKVYFYDLGLRNLIIKNFQNLDLRVDAGCLVENYFFSSANSIIKSYEDIKFWRTKSGNEVDFIVESETGITPIEIKFQNVRVTNLSLGLKSFILNYKPKIALVITKNNFNTFMKDGTKVFFIPAWAVG